MKLSSERTQIIMGLVLLVLVVAIAVIALLYKPTYTINSTSNTTTDTSNSDINTVLFEVNGLTLNGKTLTLSNDWQITDSDIGQQQLFGIRCSFASDNCNIYRVTKGDISFYLSAVPIQAFQESQDQPPVINSIPVQTAFGSINFSSIDSIVYSSLDNATDENPGVTAVNVLQEEWGCATSGLCFTTGLLPMYQEQNKIYTDAFSELLLSVTLK